MRRILVMGPPGSGKSTLARHLGDRLGLPVFHLDQAFHRPGWVAAPAETFRAEVARIAALPAWVIDGNYTDTAAPRLEAADTLIYLDMPTRLTMTRIIKRIVTSYGRVRPDAAAGCPERLNVEFLRFALDWNRIRRTRHLALVEAFDRRKIVLRGAAELRRFSRDFPGPTGARGSHKETRSSHSALQSLARRPQYGETQGDIRARTSPEPSDASTGPE